MAENRWPTRAEALDHLMQAILGEEVDNQGLNPALLIEKLACMIENGEVPGWGYNIQAYTGEYEADASFASDQVFPTNNRRMTDDFTVNAINYTVAPNDSGNTVTIGG